MDKRPYHKKFDITRIETGEKVTQDTFTLIPERDPWAKPALLAYAEACESEAPELANDLRNLVHA